MTSAGAEQRPFQVHLRGVVELLGRSIYSTPQAYLRELLQNSVDAVRARREVDGGGSSIRVTPVSAGHPTLTVVDDGVGLTLDEVADLLATVGRSSKRDVLDLPRTDRLGQFGIGLLSCFMVTDEIVVRSRSAAGGAAIEWVGRADGTFSARTLDADLPVGTEVTLLPRRDVGGLLSTPDVVAMATRFGEFLDVPVVVDLPAGGSQRVNRDPIFTRPFQRPGPPLLDLGRELIGVRPFDAFPLHVPATGTRGTAFVLPHAPAPGSRSATRTYLGGMLVAERLDGLLPDWAFFVRAVVDTTGLHPTASREALVDDDALEQTRDELARAVRRWVLRMAADEPLRLQAFLSVHDLALRGLAVHDDELAAFVVPHLTVATNLGPLTLGDVARRFGRVALAPTSEEFQQVAALTPDTEVVVDGGYVHDADLVRMLPGLVEGVEVEEVTAREALSGLASPAPHDQAAVTDVEDRATAALHDVDCDVVVRSFDPGDVAGLHVVDRDVLRRLDRRRSRDLASGPWAGILGSLDDVLDDGPEDGPDDGASARLCLNWANPLVRTLATVEDDLSFARAVRVLYGQALLAAHRPMRPADRAVLTDALTDLVHLSVGLRPQTGEPLR